ncbi:MAG: carboxypeptidase-like regulatory domain-containing protein, partial [Bacteroidota bacterium]
MRITNILFLLLTFLSISRSNTVFAQTPIRGKVIAEASNLPVAGAIISVKNTKKSVITDAKGEFSIQANNGDMLEVRSLGYISMEQKVNGLSITFSLIEQSKDLDEVVVTALGIKKESKKISYALQELKTTDLLKAREPNPINSLKGKVAGLVVNINSELLRQPSINFRGEGNILFVVDGVPIKTDTWNISPDDIESYSFLKGQTAASLYGSNGRDGVIIINTKKGSKDKRGYSIEFNSSTMFESGFLAMPKLQNEYGPGSNGKYAFRNGLGGGVNDNDYDIWGPKFNGQLLPQYDGIVDPTRTFVTTFPDGSTYTGNITPTPWIARGPNNLQNFLQTGLLSNNHIAVSSSNDKYDLRFGIGHTYQKAIIPNMDLNITNFNMAAGYQFSPKVKMSANINYSRQY